MTRKKVETVTGPKGTAVVYKDMIWYEFIAVLNGDEESAYHTDDRRDAIDTASNMVGNNG